MCRPAPKLVDCKREGCDLVETTTELVPNADRLLPQSSLHLWRIHGKLYNLRAFSKTHPGGSLAIDLVQGMDATNFFEQFHVMNDKHRSVLSRFEVVIPVDSWAKASKEKPREPSEFHDDIKAMVRNHFSRRGPKAHKATVKHALLMALCTACYLRCWVGWWRGSLVWGCLILPFFAWLIMGNLAHDGSHHASSSKPWVNELMLALGGSPLHYSFASWYMQHCISHHQHTNDPDHDTDLQHHPYAKWHRHSKQQSSAWSGGHTNLLWHWTAFMLSTINMSLVHPWKFAVAPLLQRWSGFGLPANFTMSETELSAKQSDSAKPHEAEFFRVAGVVHRNGFFEKSARRVVYALGTWLLSVSFILTPHARFGVASAKAWALSVIPYAITSLIFMTVTQVSHVQAACQLPESTQHDDFFKRQASTSLDYAVDSQIWRFLTGGLNVQSIHHVLPCIAACHYTDLYPEYFAICVKHGCAPTRKPNIIAALTSHLIHVYEVGRA